MDVHLYNLTGETFHNWHVLSFSHADENRKQYWLCRCKCGVEKAIESYNLRSGRSKSCRKCSSLVANEKQKTHGMSGEIVYKRWLDMKTKCYNERQRSYRYYGALGVQVANEWLDDFPAFHAHIGDPPSKYHVVGRRNLSGDYAPGNVKWVTQSAQVKGKQ